MLCYANSLLASRLVFSALREHESWNEAAANIPESQYTRPDKSSKCC